MTGAVQSKARVSEVARVPVERITDALSAEMAQVDAILTTQLNSSTDLIPQVASHLIRAGGKRVRPLLTLASAQLCGYQGDHHIRLAAAVEFIHTATLLHDDVVDGSATRRGRPAANRLYGNKPSILVGDFLFSRAFQLMVETGSVEVLRILSTASAVIAEGEVMQLSTANNLATTDEDHLAVIRAKTAALFAAATEVGGAIANAPPEQVEALRVYGDCLGIAFQLADDALDYAGSEGATGKDSGDDFREGKVTAPILNAYASAETDDERTFWKRVIEKTDQKDGDFEHALGLIKRHRAVERTLADARRYGDQARTAIDVFPQSALRDDLRELISYVVDRDR